MPAKRIKIYRFTFTGGRQYVGQTNQRIKTRLWQHQHEPCNTDLRDLLKSETPTIEILSSHIKKSAADAAEKAAIKKLISPLNFAGTDRKFTGGKPPVWANRPHMFIARRPYNRPRSTGMAWCCKCQKSRSAKYFHSDRSRSNGLCSRCITCQSLPKPRSLRPATCCWCAETKPAAEFHSDRSRSSGLASCCKACATARTKNMADARRSGKSTSTAYNTTKQNIIATRKTA